MTLDLRSRVNFDIQITLKVVYILVYSSWGGYLNYLRYIRKKKKKIKKFKKRDKNILSIKESIYSQKKKKEIQESKRDKESRMQYSVIKQDTHESM